MKTFSINTLGCKVNQYESQQMRELMERSELQEAASLTEQPNIIIINTCCVTQTASAKSRQYIHKVQKTCPNSAIVICGCLPLVQTGELESGEELSPKLQKKSAENKKTNSTFKYTNLARDFVQNENQNNIYIVKNRHKLAELLKQIADEQKLNSSSQGRQPSVNNGIRTKNAEKIKDKNLSELSNLPNLTAFKGQTRAFLKVQDGCDGYCSYCIIPKTRQEMFSKPIEEAVAEAQELVKAGHKEIVVTGIFLGAYGQETVRRKKWAGNSGLAELLNKLAEIPKLERIRLSSLEPSDVDERLLEVFCKHHNIMPHLHLSLQSGSNNILKKMCRQYTADDFLETVELIKSKLDSPAITTDIIVGFPGETEEDFEQTVELAKKIGFSKMHVFSFSPRKGTAAAKMQGVVKKEVIKRRSQILLDLNDELAFKFRQQFIGEKAKVLIENTDGDIVGRCERYFFVYIKNGGENLKKNEIAEVQLTENRKDGMNGTFENQESKIEI